MLVFLMISCEEKEVNTGSQAKYTLGIDHWENLGGQTLVSIHVNNPPKMMQDISIKVEAINKEKKSFTKDTMVHFDKNEAEKSFQLIVDTEGEIEDVKLAASEN